jgi:hypothetical protein
MRRHLCIAALCCAVAWAAACGDERVRIDEKGRIVPVPLPVGDEFRNPWPQDMEDGFATRADHAIRKNKTDGRYGNTYFENEKRSYPAAMMDFLNGNRKAAIAWLEQLDGEPWSRLTKNVDFFPSFTLKGQMRKYFFFGQYLSEDYRKRFVEGAKLWTAEDPMRRPNPHFKRGGDGWTPHTRNSWVDVRNTDNLRAMRECSVYLMAEETGNKKLAAEYKADIQRYVWALWHIGMGEWDSENYHCHTMAAYVQLYDFAKDPQVKRIAKAAMDMLSVMGAVKYYQGGFCGPIKRDYNKPYVFAGAAGELQLYFDDTPVSNPDPHLDHVHFVTSAYRPPPAVVKLAHKSLSGPVELFASKPPYETWKVEGGGSASKDYPAPNYQKADHKPQFFETTYIARTYQIGSLARGSNGDWNGLKMCMRNAKRGADFFVASGGATNPKHVNRGKGTDRIAHYRNLLICRSVAAEPVPYIYLVPDIAEVEADGSVTFVKAEQTWLALRPIDGTIGGVDASLKTPRGWKHCKFLSGTSRGFALEIGERQSHGDYAAFKKGVLASSRMKAEGSTVEYVGSKGRRVKIDVAGGDLPKVYRDGKLHDWKRHWDLWRPADGSNAPVRLGWKTGRLHVEAGGWAFDAEFADDGGYRFTNTRTKK